MASGQCCSGPVRTSNGDVGAHERIRREIEHGQTIAERAEEIWNWSSPAGRLRWARRAAMLAGSVSAGARVLEVGCGTGMLTSALVQRGARVTAIDVSAPLLASAGRRLAGTDARFLFASASELGFASNTFEWVIGSSVLHHLDVPQALREFRRVLKARGTICFAEPNMLNPQIAIQKNIPVVKRMMGDTPDETAFVRWRLAALLSRVGFGNIRITPFDFLHPATPRPLIPVVQRLGRLAEATIGLSEIAGSLYIRGEKP